MPVKINVDGTYLTVEETAEALGLSIDSVRRYCNAKKPKLVGRKLGREWFIPKAEIERYKRERQGVGRPHAQKSA